MSDEQRSHNRFWKKSSPFGDNMGFFAPSQPYCLLDITEDLSKLETIEETTSKYRLPPGVKPCISALLSRRGSIRTLESRRVPCIIAGELKRVGQTSNQIQKKLEKWGKATPFRDSYGQKINHLLVGTSWTHPPHKSGKIVQIQRRRY